MKISFALLCFASKHATMKITKIYMHTSSTISATNKPNDKKVYLSNCFYDIEKIISQNKLPLQELQNQIETYLFNYESTYSVDKPHINFNRDTSKWILDKRDLLMVYIGNMIKDDTNKLTGLKISIMQKYIIQTKDIITVLTADKVASLLISFFLDLTTRESNEGRLIQTDLFAFFGNKLINLYIFVLYSKSLKGVEKANHYTLSTWKSNNQDIIKRLSDSPTIVSVGGNVAQFLTTPEINMIEFDLEYGDDRKLHHIIKVQEAARSVVLKDNQIIYSTPPKLPMVLEPKPYKQDGDGIILGGYLNNDVFYT